jgi:hypothetical protein
MRTVKSGAGYIFVDDTSSGGLRREEDMLGCYHCQMLMTGRGWANAGAPKCHNCDGPICVGCGMRALQHGCENFLRQITGALEAEYRRAQNERVLGS